jgi:hypothetical protein
VVRKNLPHFLCYSCHWLELASFENRQIHWSFSRKDIKIRKENIRTPYR